MSLLNMFSSARLKKEADFRTFMLTSLEEMQYTPDALQLERKTDHFIFVVDEMMSKHPEHKTLGESKFMIAPSAFTVDKLSMWQHSAGKYSSAVPMVEPIQGIPTEKIRGELYLVKTKDILRLDIAKKNGVEFIRIPVQVDIPYRMAKKVKMKDKALFEWAVSQTPSIGTIDNVWLYVGHPDYWNALLNKGTKAKFVSKDGSRTYVRINVHGSFQAVSCIKPNNPIMSNYYYFRPNEQPTRSNDS